MINHKDIDRARRVLGLGECASKKEIKEAYRKLANKYHPDKCPPLEKKECEKKFKEITFSYQLLEEYISSYRYCFGEKEVKRAGFSKETYEHLKKFYDGWWGELDF